MKIYKITKNHYYYYENSLYLIKSGLDKQPAKMLSPFNDFVQDIIGFYQKLSL